MILSNSNSNSSTIPSELKKKVDEMNQITPPESDSDTSTTSIRTNFNSSSIKSSTTTIDQVSILNHSDLNPSKIESINLKSYSNRMESVSVKGEEVVKPIVIGEEIEMGKLLRIRGEGDDPLTKPLAVVLPVRCLSRGVHYDEQMTTIQLPSVESRGILDSFQPSSTTHSNLNHNQSLFNSVASSQRPILERGISDTTTTTNATTSKTTGGGGGSGWRKKATKVSPEQKRLAALGFDEELSRDFDFWASWGIGVCNIGYLPGTFLGILTALSFGGGSMWAIAWPIVGIFMCSIAAVLGEMASAYPVAGAMFTWTFRLSRSSKRFDPYARYFSWIVGSFLLCYHILAQIVIAFQLSSVIQGIIGFFVETHTTTFWETMAISWGVLVLSGLIVSSKLSRSPWLWRGCGIALVVGFIVMNVVLLTKAKEIRSARSIFTDYQNDTGWDSKAYVYMLGWTLTTVATGMEAIAHVAEDTKSPARTVPAAMFWSTAASYAMGWVTICVLLATTQSEGTNPHYRPAIGLLANTLPRGYTTLILFIVLFSMLAQNIAQLLASSRFIWALARESAIPFSPFFYSISTHHQPLNAIWVVVFISIPSLLLLGISQHIVGTILLEGAGWTIMFCYGVPIILYLFCSKDALAGDGRSKWTLRGWSRPLAWFCALGSGVCLVMYCLPTGYPVTALSASYAPAVAFGVLLLSTLAWVFYGNSRYAGPIKTTTKWTIGAEIDLATSTTFKSTTGPGGVGAGAGAGGGGAAGGEGGGSLFTTSAGLGQTARVFSSFEDSRGSMSRSMSMSERSRRTDETGTWDDRDDDEDHEEEEEEEEDDEEEESRRRNREGLEEEGVVSRRSRRTTSSVVLN